MKCCCKDHVYLHSLQKIMSFHMCTLIACNKNNNPAANVCFHILYSVFHENVGLKKKQAYETNVDIKSVLKLINMHLLDPTFEKCQHLIKKADN